MIDITGVRWRPVPASGSANPQAFVEFRSDQTWVGSDGCNRDGGTYNLGADGAFSATRSSVSTMIYCRNMVKVGDILHRTAQIEHDRQRLAAFSDDGELIMTFDASGQ